MSEPIWCSKHGLYDSGKNVWCPKCLNIREKEICVECEKHKGTVDYTESTMDWIHFGSQKLCFCCYFNKVEEAYFNVKANYEKLLAEKKPCEEV